MEIESLPLITPERLTAHPECLLDYRPKWLRNVWVHRPEPDEPPLIVLLVGQKHLLPISITPTQCAVLLEVTRFGHSIATNTNSGTPPSIYAKVSFRDAPHDNFPIDRLWRNAGLHEATTLRDRKPKLLVQDHRPDNLEVYGAGKPEKNARLVARRHFERLARDRGVGEDRLSACLANLDRLFAAIDAEVFPDGVSQ